MSGDLPYEYTHEDYEKVKQGFINDNIDKLKDLVYLIEARPDLFPETVNAIAIYSATKDEKPESIEKLKKGLKTAKKIVADINTEIKENAQYFNELADISWRDGVVEMLINHVKYNPKKAGEDGRFQEALLKLFGEYLEDKYIQDTDFIQTSLERGLFLKKRPDSNWAAVSVRHLATAEAKARKKALKGRLAEILGDRKETEEAVAPVAAAGAAEQFNMKNAKAALKAMAKLENSAPAAAGVGNVASLARSLGALSIKKDRKAMGAAGAGGAIFEDLSDPDIRRLRSLDELNKFIARVHGIRQENEDQIKVSLDNVFKFMKYTARDDPALNPLKNMESIDTSGAGSDCLIHTFLTMTCWAFRKLQKGIKDKVARSFRHHLYPAFAETRKLLEDERISTEAAIPIYNKAKRDFDAEKRGYSKERLEKEIANLNRLKENTIPSNRIRIFTIDEFLDDRDIGRLTAIYDINAIVFQGPAVEHVGAQAGVLQPAIITFSENVPGAPVYTFLNRGNAHYESVRQKGTHSFTIDYDTAARIYAAGQRRLAAAARVTGCRFKQGDKVRWGGRGGEWPAGEYYVIERKMKNPEECKDYILTDQAGFDIFNTLTGYDKDDHGMWTAMGMRYTIPNVPHDEVLQLAAGGGRRRQTRRHRLKSKRHHSFRNPR